MAVKKLNKIGVLTSGGDAPGMNAAIRAIVRYGCYLGMEVVGIERGYHGLLNKAFRPMGMRSVSDIVHRGGTVLKTARCEDFKTAAGQETGVRNVREAGIQGLIVIGGDGSFAGARCLSERGIPTIGIPGTIDNDLAYTDYTLGFDTAVNTVLDAINKLRDTMTSHDRISIVEVMGRHCGDIALYAGLGGGAEVIIAPECKPDIETICGRLRNGRESGKVSGIVVLAEGAGRAEDYAREIAARTGYTIRPTVLGHIQRGGAPTNADRRLGSMWGAHAVKLLDKGIGNRIIGIKANKIFDVDIAEGLKATREIDMDIYNTAAILAL
ncbi:ATP-dependent 6-phosphofructokinase [Clostridia bacterium]|nr:ATP-dependent 6-phosphofructokinase [Clostridia bacterium]